MLKQQIYADQRFLYFFDNSIKVYILILERIFNIINIQLTKMNSEFRHHTFALSKFEPGNIILLNINTRKLYRYVEVPNSAAQSMTTKSDIILEGEKLCGGFIYEKQLSSLEKQVQSRIHAGFKQYYNENQLNNTFEPILSFLQKDSPYTGLSLQSILIDVEGNIRLKDPRLNQAQHSESQFEKLGLIMLQIALLKSENQIIQLDKSKQNLAGLLKRYSAKFIANIFILLNGPKNLIKDIQLSETEPKTDSYKQAIQEIRILMNPSFTSSIKQKKDIFKSRQQKKIIVIPPLNLKFNKVKKPELKIDLSGKSRHHNENQNEQSLSKMINNPQKVHKILDFKYKTNKILEEKAKLRLTKKELIENYESPIKKKGKTVDKKAKFQQRRN